MPTLKHNWLSSVVVKNAEFEFRSKEDNIERKIPLLVPYIGLYASLYVTSPAFLLKSGRERLDGGGGTGDGVYRRRAL